MLTPEDVLEKVKRVVKIRRPFDSNLGAKKTLIPEYYPNYGLMVEYYERIKVHAEERGFPHRLFASRYPNQTNEEFKYQKDNFKRKTHPVFVEYINTVGRAFIEQNFSIQYNGDATMFEDSGLTLENYLTEEFPIYGSILNWGKNALPSIKATDANGVIAVKPKEIPLTVIDDEVVQDRTKLIEPAVFYYNIRQLVGWEPDEFAIIELSKKSPVMFSKRTELKGFIYEVYDDTNIWHVVQVGKFTDHTFEVHLFFAHEWDKVPVIKNLGIISLDEFNRIIYSSPFMFATPDLDQVLLDSSNLQISKAKDVFPIRVMPGDRCDFEDGDRNSCRNGRITIRGVDGAQDVSRTCPDCNGSGMKNRISIMGTLLTSPPDREGKGDIPNPISFVSPDITTLEFLRKEIKEGLRDAMQMLHLTSAKGFATGGNDVSATQKLLDAKNLGSFVMPISNQTWQILEFSIRAIGWMRYKDDFIPPTITPPKEFDFKTTSDYLEEIRILVEAGAPPFLVHEVLTRLLNSMFHSDIKAAKSSRVIIAADRLLTLSQEDIRLAIGGGGAQKWQGILHNSAPSLLAALIRENNDFLDQDLQVQIDALEQSAKDIADEAAKEVQKAAVAGILDPLIDVT